MDLHVTKRDYYKIGVDIEPDLSGTREASFDGGLTYIEGTAVGEDWAWLVAGPDFVPDDEDDAALTDATIARSMNPLIRVKEAPVVDVGEGPPINLWY